MKWNSVFSSLSRKKKFSWWQGALFLIAVSILGRLSGRELQQSDGQYESQKTPLWSPPAWLFGVAWPLNNIALIWAAIRLLNSHTRFPNRQLLLRLQGAHWFIFITFGWVYFRQRSPWLTTLWTQGDALVALRSYQLAREDDKRLAQAYLPLNIWTWYASTVAWYQALYNPDPLLDTPALLEE